MKPISGKRQIPRVLNPDYLSQMRTGGSWWQKILVSKFSAGMPWLSWWLQTPFADTLWNHRHNKSRDRAPEFEREICTSFDSVSASIKFKGTGESSRGYWASVNTSKHAQSYRFILQLKKTPPKIGQAKKYLFLITEIGEQRRTSQAL